MVRKMFYSWHLNHLLFSSFCMDDWIVHVWSSSHCALAIFWLDRFEWWQSYFINVLAWPDEGKNEISYQQQPAPKHQYKTYRDDSESDGGSTESKSSTKINKPKTQVHRTQFIFGLKSQKAAAERRRFDVNKFIEKSHGSNRLITLLLKERSMNIRVVIPRFLLGTY